MSLGTLAQAHGWRAGLDAANPHVLRVHGSVDEQAFQVRAPAASDSAEATLIGVRAPNWLPDGPHGAFNAERGWLIHTLIRPATTLETLRQSFAAFHRFALASYTQWANPGADWRPSKACVVWPSHPNHTEGPQVEIGDLVLDTVLHATGDPSPLRPLFQDPAAVEATLAVLHAYPGSRLVERGVVLLAAGDLGEGLAPALNAVSVLAEHLDRLPSAVRPIWEAQ